MPATVLPTRKKIVFSTTFRDIGDPDESLEVKYVDADGTIRTKKFTVGEQVFLEDQSQMDSVPDEQLIASASMGAILAGGILPGTKEFLTQVASDQSNKWFQTIVGDARVKEVNRVPGDDTGLEFDVVFKRGTSNNNTKTVRVDAHQLSDYGQRSNNYGVSVYCIPGALHNEFGFKKSQLGVEGSQNRQDVLAYVADIELWV